MRPRRCSRCNTPRWMAGNPNLQSYATGGALVALVELLLFANAVWGCTRRVQLGRGVLPHTPTGNFNHMKANTFGALSVERWSGASPTSSLNGVSPARNSHTNFGQETAGSRKPPAYKHQAEAQFASQRGTSRRDDNRERTWGAALSNANISVAVVLSDRTRLRIATLEARHVSR